MCYTNHGTREIVLKVIFDKIVVDMLKDHDFLKNFSLAIKWNTANEF